MATNTLLLVSFIFLLRSQASNSQVDNTFCETSSSGTDFVTEAIRLARPARIGGCTYNHVRVSSNGYITFGPEQYLRKLPNFYEAPMPILSVFGADLDHALVCTSSTERQSSRAYRLMGDLPSGPPAYVFGAFYNLMQNNSIRTSALSVYIAFYWYDSTLAGVIVRSQSSNSSNWSPSNQMEVIIGYSFGVRDNPGLAPVVVAASPAYSRFMSSAGYAANFSQFEPLTKNFSYGNTLIPTTAFTGFVTPPATNVTGNSQCNFSSDYGRWTSFVDEGILFPYATNENPYNISGQQLDTGLDVSVVVQVPPTKFGSCAHDFVQIGSNGYIRLGTRGESLISYSSGFAGSELMLEVNPVVAVYAAHMVPANGSGIFYSIHTQASDAMHDLVSRRLAQYNSSIAFKPTFTLVVTYHQVALENMGKSRITAQLVIAADSVSTHLFLNYANASRDLEAVNRNMVPYVFIGFSSGKLEDSLPTVIADMPSCVKMFAYTSANSIDYMRSDILGNTGLPGRWYYPVSRGGLCATGREGVLSRRLFEMMRRSEAASGVRKFDFRNVGVTVRKQYLQHCLDGTNPSSARIDLLSSVRFGTCSYSTAFISSFGAIVLGNLTDDVLTYDSSAIFGQPNVALPGPLIAPFIARMNKDFGRTSYAQFTNDSSPQVLASFQERLAKLNETSFTPTYALVVDWSNMRSTLDNVSDTMSFQLVLLSDGRKTGLFFFYSSMANGFQTSRPSNDVALDVGVGFTYGPLNDPIRFPTQQVLRSPSEGERFSSLNIAAIQSNTRYRSVWYWTVNTSDGDCSAVPLTVPARLSTPTPPQIESILPNGNASKYNLNPQCMVGNVIDDDFLTLLLANPLQIGGCNHSSALISSNGYVVFSYRSTAIRPSASETLGPVLAPFNGDLKTAGANSICYTTHTEGDPYLNEIVQRMMLVGASPMTIKSALVITWFRVKAYYSGSFAPPSGPTFTFQVVMFSNGTNTNFFFNYDPSNSLWQNSPLNVGYFYGTILDPSGRAAVLRQFPAPGETRMSVNLASTISNSGLRGVYYFEPRYVSTNCVGLIPTTTTTVTINPLDNNILPCPQSPSGWVFPSTITSLRPNTRVQNGGCLENADDGVDMVTLPSPLPFGGCNHSAIYISTNGYITLTRSQRGTLSAIESAETPSLGPFTVDLYPQGYQPVICYTMHSSGDPYLNLIARRNSQLPTPAAVTVPRFAFVVTYYRVAEYGSSASLQRTTFQIVLFTDGTNTSFYYNYDVTNNAPWLAYRNVINVGYTYGSFLDPQNLYRVLAHYPGNTSTIVPIYYATLFQNSGRGGVSVYNAMNIPNADCTALITGQRPTSPYPSMGPSNLLPSPQTVADRRVFVQSECLPPRDDYIESIVLPEPITYGGCNHSLLHLSVNGFATLTRPAPIIRPSFGSVDVPFFAPFNTDLDGRLSTTTVCYSLHRWNDTFVRNFTERLFPSESFQMKLAVVATWLNIDEYSTGQRVSFQLAIVTNGTETFIFFLYELLPNPWTIRSSNPVVQGTSYGVLLDPLNSHTSLSNFTESTLNFRRTNIGIPGVLRYQNTLNNPDCKAALGLISTVRPTPALPRFFLPAPQISPTVFQNSGCLPSRDDFVAPVTLLSSLPFGGCRHSTAFISTNGFLSLSRQVMAIRSAVTGSEAPIIAPLQTDLHAMRDDTVCYTMHSEGDVYLSLISQLFATLRKPAMSIRFALVVTYYRINEYASGGLSSSEVSFQVAIVTDGVDTRLLFIYDYQSAYLNLRPPVHVGYSFGSMLDPYNQTSSYSDLNYMPNLVSSSNTDVQGVWYFTPGTAPNVDYCAMLVNTNASVTAPPLRRSTWLSGPSVVNEPPIFSSRIDTPLPSSPLAVCNQVSNSPTAPSVCRCRSPFIGDGKVCRGASKDVVMFPYAQHPGSGYSSTLKMAGYVTGTSALPLDVSFGGEVYSLFSVSNNGYLQFHTSSAQSVNYVWPSTASYLPKVIVFGADLVFYADQSEVSYKIFTENSTQGDVVARATQLVRNFTDDLRFTARLVLVLTFSKMLRTADVPYLSGRPLPAVTAQAVIISAGPHNATYVNLNYEFTDYVSFVPLRDFISEYPLLATNDAALAAFDMSIDTAAVTRVKVINAVENSRLLRSGNSSMSNANAFDQLVGNTGILGSWLYRVDGRTVLDAVTRRASNPAPQSFSDVFETARQGESQGASCNETFTMYARIRVNMTSNARRSPLSALQADLSGSYGDLVSTYGGQLMLTFFNLTQYGQNDLDVAIRVGLQCLGNSGDLAYFKRDSTFRSAISYILVKHGFSLEDQVINLQQNCWPPKTMLMYSDCTLKDDRSWQNQLDLQYAGKGYLTKFKRVFSEQKNTVIEFEITGDCTDPLSLTPIHLSCANTDGGSGKAQVGGGGHHNGAIVLAVILAILGTISVVGIIYLLRKKIPRIDLMGPFTVRRSEADGFEVPCNNFSSSS